MEIKFNNGNSWEAHPVRFCILDDRGEADLTFDGFEAPTLGRWNGWLQPYVTREVYLQIIEKHITPQLGTPDEEHLREWFHEDGLVNGIPSADDKPDTACGLYNVGWGWVWDTV